MKGTNSMKKVYFAHSIKDYNTKKEAATLRRLRAHKDWKVICPNTDLGELPGGMRAYLEVVAQCDLVIAMEHKGFVGRRVFCEIYRAFCANKPAFVLRKGKLFEVVTLKENDPNDWETYYGKLITDGIATAL